MHYILLIYRDEAHEPPPGTPEMEALMGGYMKFTESVRTAGQLVSGEPLEPVASAVTVRVRGGRTETTDGPFAETKEQLGGFYILDCASLEEAVARAAEIPSAAIGSVEVRPIMVFEPPG